MSPLIQALKKFPLAARVNAALKARQQERRAARNLSLCRAEAARRGIVELPEPELTTALRARLNNRPHPAWPKPKGALHVFMPFYLENWEFVLPLSMQPFGKVTTFDWRERGYDPRKPDWIDRRKIMNAEMLDCFKSAHAAQPIDAVVGYLSGHNTAPDTLREMARSGAAIFNCCYDDKLHFPGELLGGRDTSPAAIAAAVDLHLTSAPESVIKYYVHGGLAIFCPAGAQPNIHAPQSGDFEYDVSFVGANYGWRGRFIEALKNRGIEIHCFGKGWPAGPVSDAEVVRIFSHSRINLGMAGIAHSNKLCCLKGRDAEIPMTGGLYLTQHHADLAHIYQVGTEILTYRDAADCARQIRDLLADPGRAAKIRAAGHQRARSTHSWESRWTQIFRLAGILTQN